MSVYIYIMYTFYHPSTPKNWHTGKEDKVGDDGCFNMTSFDACAAWKDGRASWSRALPRCHGHAELTWTKTVRSSSQVMLQKQPEANRQVLKEAFWWGKERWLSLNNAKRCLLTGATASFADGRTWGQSIDSPFIHSFLASCCFFL